ncbi:putative phospholipid-transporting ATPase IIA [Manis javanica]|nr:putative phospholipid-transporting ATPase IIA [Manis javanica]
MKLTDDSPQRPLSIKEDFKGPPEAFSCDWHSEKLPCGVLMFPRSHTLGYKKVMGDVISKSRKDYEK